MQCLHLERQGDIRSHKGAVLRLENLLDALRVDRDREQEAAQRELEETRAQHAEREAALMAENGKLSDKIAHCNTVQSGHQTSRHTLPSPSY